MSLGEIDKLMNNKSGLKGMCGTNDMREVIDKSSAGEERAKIALEVYCYRIKKYIGAYFAVLGHLDGLVFAAGIGENAAVIRELCCQGLSTLGIEIDQNRNWEKGKRDREISSPGSQVKILVVPTNEGLRIAQETKRVLKTVLTKGE
jgi:acetate kinase